MRKHSSLSLAIELLQRSSITPDDAGCQDMIEAWLAPYGFSRQRIDKGGVRNSIYYRQGERDGCLAFAGHTDVVPTGPLDRWVHPPFAAVLDDNHVLYGRGAQDMKGAIACWIAAIIALIEQGIPLPSLQMLITSDEEGESIDGTIRIIEYLQAQQQLPQACIVGEPSCSKHIGDTIRRGRRGVVQARIVFHGKQGHSAYPADADNAIHHAAPALAKIVAIDWGKDCDGFPATSCQITNIHAGTGATNVIPGEAEVHIDIRYNPSISFEYIQSTLHQCCANAHATLHIEHIAEAFSTPDGALIDAVAASILRITHIDTCKDTGGGTSDGRFISKAGIPVVELGLTNSSIHQINERVPVQELETLTHIYSDIIRTFEVTSHV